MIPATWQREDEETRYVAAGLTAVLTAGFSYLLLRSGDTNSLAGLACTVLALVASRAAARGARWGGPLLVVALVLLNYVHAGFLIYAVLFLVLEAIFYRDRARLRRGRRRDGLRIRRRPAAPLGVLALPGLLHREQRHLRSSCAVRVAAVSP